MTDPDEQLSIDEELETFEGWLRRVCQSLERASDPASYAKWPGPIVDRDPGDETDEPPHAV